MGDIYMKLCYEKLVDKCKFQLKSDKSKRPYG